MTRPSLAVRLAALPVLLLAGAGACAQTIELPLAYPIPAPGLVIITPTKVDADSVEWISFDAGLQLIPGSYLKDDRAALGFALQAGTYRIQAIAAKTVDGKAKQARSVVCVVTVGAVPPGPGPGPGPDPKPPPVPPPPDPVPPPVPPPIPVDGFRVLIVYESSELATMPRAQLVSLYAQQVRDYLAAHCVKGPDGRTAEWRVWDQNVSTANEAKLWQDAMARKRDKLPWIVISTGKTGYEGPLPADTAGTLELLRKYGGP